MIFIQLVLRNNRKWSFPLSLFNDRKISRRLLNSDLFLVLRRSPFFRGKIEWPGSSGLKSNKLALNIVPTTIRQLFRNKLEYCLSYPRSSPVWLLSGVFPSVNMSIGRACQEIGIGPANDIEKL